MCWCIQISIDQSTAKVHFGLDVLGWSLKMPDGVTGLKRGKKCVIDSVHTLRSKTIKEKVEKVVPKKPREVDPLSFKSFIVINEANHFYFFWIPERKDYLHTSRMSVDISNNEIWHAVRIAHTKFFLLKEQLHIQLAMLGILCINCLLLKKNSLKPF